MISGRNVLLTACACVFVASAAVAARQQVAVARCNNKDYYADHQRFCDAGVVLRPYSIRKHSRETHRHRKPVNVYGYAQGTGFDQERYWQGTDYDRLPIYRYGYYQGTDPDPFIRSQIIRDPTNISHGGW